jgi:hypothetical protein
MAGSEEPKKDERKENRVDRMGEDALAAGWAASRFQMGQSVRPVRGHDAGPPGNLISTPSTSHFYSIDVLNPCRPSP